MKMVRCEEGLKCAKPPVLRPRGKDGRPERSALPRTMIPNRWEFAPPARGLLGPTGTTPEGGSRAPFDPYLSGL